RRGAIEIVKRLRSRAVAEREVAAANRIKADGFPVGFRRCADDWNGNREANEPIADGLARRSGPEPREILLANYDLSSRWRNVSAARPIKWNLANEAERDD